MNTLKNSGSAETGTVELDPPAGNSPIESAPSPTPRAVDPASEADYWHVNYMTRPYYKEGWNFGDYEAAYRYGSEHALEQKETTFEEAETARLASGWAEARGKTPHTWEEIREAARDAWTHARRTRQPD
ncbi:MAG: hypothetical protein L6R30_03245 [Thermoanaerobaculia bacterium]|nr:hypothetical protein [Thermoanaerobaculia bacterium]